MSILKVIEKAPFEKIDLNSVFSKKLAAWVGVSLLATPSPTIVKSRFPGNEAADELVVEAVSLNAGGDIVQARYSGGTRNLSYLIQARARASNGMDLEVEGLLKIKDLP